MRGLNPKVDPNWLSAAHHSLIIRMLATCEVEVLVAARAGFPDDWYGYIVGEPTRQVLHWLFVKKSFRRGGVATRLLEGMFGEPRGELIEVTTHAPDLRYLTAWNFSKRSYRLCEAVQRGQPPQAQPPSPRQSSPKPSPSGS